MNGVHIDPEAWAGWPLIGGMVRRRAREAFLANRHRNLFFGLHDTWEAAAAAAAALGPAGYDNEASSRLYESRVRMDPHDYPSLHWLYRSLDEGLSGVFDVGGATGIKFLAFRDALKRFADLRWRVQDVPAMVEHGRRLAEQRGDHDRLEFTTSFGDADGFDILFASGVLQYLPATLAELLGGWRRLPRRIIINTAAVHPQHDFFTVNSIGTAFCPYRVQTQAALVRGLSKLGYRVRETWINPDKPLHIPFHPGHSLQHYSGFCLDLAGTVP
ncbi:MAG: methyltransferase, TIGR04325 family [Rubrivivax sp.]|nr:methyltransferase, TIGR04325 family [Rubrivivax sp.]